MKLGVAVVMLAVLPVGAAWAQPQRLEVGQTYVGAVSADDPQGPIVFFGIMRQACFTLSTQAGSAYQLELKRSEQDGKFDPGPYIQIGTGPCDGLKSLMGAQYSRRGPGRLAFIAGGGDYAVRVWSIRPDPTSDPFVLAASALPAGQTKLKTLPAGASTPPRPVVNQAEAAYGNLCRPGAMTLSAATCQAMKRDLDRAAAAKGNAEVAKAYGELCAPGAEKLSKETCTAMKADARRGAPAAAAVPAKPAKPSIIATVPGRTTPAASQAPAAAKPQAASPPAAAPTPQPVRLAAPNWGGLDSLVGGSYRRQITVSDRMASYTGFATHTFRWKEPGVSIVDDLAASHGNYSYNYVIDPATNTPAGYLVEGGMLVTPPVEVNGKLMRTAIRVIGGGFETHTQTRKGTQWKTILMGKETFLAPQQQQASSGPSMFGAMVQGAILGATGAEMPAMREDGTAPSMLDTLNAANASMERQNAEGKARLDASIAAAQAPPPRQGGGSGPAARPAPTAPQRAVAAPPKPAPKPAAAQGQPVRFYYWVGMAGRKAGDRNIRCYSNVVALRDRFVPHGYGEADKAVALVEPYRATFIDRCRRAGGVFNPNDVQYQIDGLNSFQNSPRWNADDQGVTLP